LIAGAVLASQGPQICDRSKLIAINSNSPGLQICPGPDNRCDNNRGCHVELNQATCGDSANPTACAQIQDTSQWGGSFSKTNNLFIGGMIMLALFLIFLVIFMHMAWQIKEGLLT